MSTTNQNRVLTPENLEGEVLSGCKVLCKIAIGGMGTIYKARQLSMNRDVAVKVLSDELSKDRAYVQRFILEARAAGELSHTNLIHVIDVGTHHNLYYYVMEFVDGEGLDAIIEKRGTFPPGEALDIVLQVAGALDHAHRKAIIHRDIKPDNIILMPNGQIKLADLGIAKRVTTDGEGITQPGMVLGTPFYMAPEQGKDSRLVDRRSDIYALGASFYHMLSGKVPFDGKTCLEVVLKAIEAKPEPLLQIKENLPPRVVAICEKMMQKEPQDRYQTTQEVIQDLERVKAGLDPLGAPMPMAVSRMAGARAAAAAAAPKAAPKPPPAAANAPASADQVNLFDVDELDVGSQKAAPAGGSRHAPSPKRPTAETKPRPPAKPKPAKSTPAGDDEGGLFEMDELSVKETNRPPAEEPERSAPRAPREIDLDRPPRRPSAPALRPAPPEEESADDSPARPPTVSVRHGALNVRMSEERTPMEQFREKVLPGLTLGAGILLLVIGGVWVLRSDRPRVNPGKSESIRTTGTGEQPVATVTDTPEAIAALERATLYTEQHPEDLVQSIESFMEVIRSYGASQAAVAAKTRVDELQKRFDVVCDERVQAIEAEWTKARAQRSYAATIELLRVFREQRGMGKWKDKADQLSRDILAEAGSVCDEALRIAGEFEAAGNHRTGLTTLAEVMEIGVPDLVARLEARQAKMADGLRKASESARKVFAEQYLASETVKEHAAHRRFHPIESQLEGYIKDPAMRSIRYELESELEPVHNASRLMEAMTKSIEGRAGQDETIKLAKSVRQGKIVGIEDEKIVLELAGRKLGCPIVDMVHEEVFRLALMTLGANRGESHILVAGYYQTSGMLEEAAKQLETARSLGADVRLARQSWEEAALRKRVQNGNPLDLSSWQWESSREMTVDYQPLSFHTRVAGIDSAWTSTTPWSEYIFSLRARRRAGLHGLLVTIKVGEGTLVWALGDEQNSQSWVRGYPETRSESKLTNHRWYDLKIVVVGGVALGYQDGVRIWRVEPKEAAGEGPPKLGVGATYTATDFADLALVDLVR